MGYKLITPPIVEPISLDEIKQDLRIGDNDSDGSLTRMLAEARQYLETRLQFKFLTQTWEFVIDAFPTNEIRLPFGPVQSIMALNYDDELGAEQTLPPEDYYLDDASVLVIPEPWVFPTDVWPATLDAINSVRVRFVCGYDAPEKVPGEVKTAMRLKMRELYDGDDLQDRIEAAVQQAQLLAY